MINDSELDLLLREHVKTTVQAAVTAIGLWLRKHIVDVSNTQLMQDVINEFQMITEQTIESRQYQRRQMPRSYKLPGFSWARVDSLSEEAFLSHMQDMSFAEGIEFIAQLIGAWILACPEVMIRNIDGIQIDPNATEVELILTMKKALYRSLL